MIADSDSQRLSLVRTVHTIIYVVLAVSIVYILVAAIAGLSSPPLFVALGLTAVEIVVFVSSGMKCPLTALARKYGAPKGYAFDTWLPEVIARYTFWIFGLLLAVGLGLLVLRLVRLL
jgi:hypothetical protein